MLVFYLCNTVKNIPFVDDFRRLVSLIMILKSDLFIAIVYYILTITHFGGISVKFKDSLMRRLSHSFKEEKFETTKEVITIRNSKNDIH